MATSRTGRIAGGLSLSYLHTGVTTIVGLWLTPFLLRNLDQHNYGLWLLTAQMLFYLGLTDLGIVALLPREVAFTAGRPAATLGQDVRNLVGETAKIVLWQLPVAAAVGLVTWWVVWRTWPSLSGPFGVVVATFVVTFPLRIFHAVLQGLQDLTWLGGVQLASWIGGTIVTIVLVDAGVGIYALAAGWATTQGLGALLAWHRLRHQFADVLPAKLPRLAVSAARAHLGRGLWISVSQVAQVLLNGTDLLVIGAMLGPNAVVPYACTGKLITLLSNQPQLFMQTTLPALSELRASAPRARMSQVSTSLTQLLMIASGAVACTTLVFNGSFVTWWVGPNRFGGPTLSALMVLAMLLRHWNVSAVYTLFCFGHERRLTITTALDGVVGLLAMAALVPRIGIHGAIVGSIIGTVAISLPGNLRALARLEGAPVLASIRPLRQWFVRFAPVAVGALAAIAWGPTPTLVVGALAAAAVGIIYVALMVPVALNPPLGAMLAQKLRPWLVHLPSWSRRFVGELTS